MQLSRLFHWKATPTRAFNEFLYVFVRIFLISENSLKFANFFAEVTNSRSMVKIPFLSNTRWRTPAAEKSVKLRYSAADCAILMKVGMLN